MTTAALELLPDGVVIADADGIVTAANGPAVRLLELAYSPVGQRLAAALAVQNLDGRDWFSCLRPYDGLATRTRLQESSWRTTTGRELLLTAALHREAPAGKVTQVAVGIRDAQSRERVDKERSDLVATVAHELRSPLTGVKGFTSTLLSKWDRLTESQRKLMLRTVDADADRLSRLIAELLDVARIDSNRLSVHKAPVDLAAAVRSQLEPLSTPEGRQLMVESVGRPRIWVDGDKFAQVVANLVDNAFRHGDGTVTVRLREADDHGVELLVDDEGTGISGDIRPRIFTKFWRHGSRGGSGLGLYIVHGLVRAHDGQVFVETAPSGGARMRVVLPNAEPELQPTAGRR